MENVVLIIHLLLALSLIGAVLMQRSEGGGLGMGGGGGGAMSARSTATALGKVTWVLGIGLLITTLALTIIAAEKSSGTSVVDRLGLETAPAATSDTTLPDTDGLLAPAAGTEDAPLVPRAD